MRLATLERLTALQADRTAVAVVTDTRSGEERLVEAGAAAADPLAAELQGRFRSGRSGMLDDGQTFLTVYLPPPRLVIVGAVHVSQALGPMAAATGLDVVIVDPRTAFATPERFPAVPLIAEWPEDAADRLALDRYTAVAALTHDPKIDDWPLLAALAAGCFYVGALGSRKTHAKRLERLAAQGAAADGLGRLRAPIGLDIGAASPAEIAVAILAEVIAALRNDPDARRDTAR